MTFHKVKRVNFGFKTEKKMLQVKLDTWAKRVDKRKMEHCTCVHAEMANYKSKVNFLQQHLADLLTQKKALHSRVVAEEFHKFKLTSSRVISGDATAAEVRQTLTGLEKALKKEGLFKNVKSGFIHLKKEFLSSSSSKAISKPPSDPQTDKPKRSTTSVIADHKKERIQTVEKDNDEVKNLNKAVGRLFENLKIQKLSEIARESTGLAITHDRSPTMMTKKPDDTDDFKEIIKKVRGLEMELLRQKASQSSELKRLAEENTGLRHTISELRREQERVKGLQPITKTAKDKQVEKLEEQYNKQKKGMEGKIVELESELEENLNTTLREKAELEQMIVDGVSKLKASITALHRRLCADANLSERTRTTLTLNGAADERKNIDILINKIIQIEESADLLEEKNRELGMILIEKDDEIGKLRNSLIEISEEVSKMHGSLTTLEKSPTVSKEDRTSRELDTHETRAVISKLQHVHTSIQQYKRILLEKERSTVSPKNNDDLITLKHQINRLYEDFVEDGDGSTDMEKSTGSLQNDTPKTQRERTNEINQLLQKLSRVEKAFNSLRAGPGSHTSSSSPQDLEQS
ncbi:CAP-Gly domain-containing linker protein 1-like isoform X2 [Crassostrea angulata]|uniref:CAP-Gly domain-containing linker protein 1-like isoform X2 n=1 Tax=Magallana angulata TaxID=2784310 RepID=UPI0022B0AF58|nr:CAP-Gly domain-containing linker protein 1-like isoform X2 [Crassostrea angulata]